MSQLGSLSILITYHEEGELLSECIRSLEASGQWPAEIIVYDDASQRPAREFLPDGIPVRLLRGNQNIGPAGARNRLLQAARAEYVHFHDADDLFLPGWAERVSARLGDGVDCVFTEVETVHEDGRRFPAVLGLTELKHSGDLLSFCLRRSLLTPSGTYRRERVQKMGGYNERLWQSEDFEFHARWALSGPAWAVVDEPLVRARVRSASRSKKQLEVWQSAWQAVRELMPQVPASHKSDLAWFCERAGHQLLQLGDGESARSAFDFAEQHGLRAEELAPVQRSLVRLLGLARAHQVAAVYRAAVPARLRRLLAALRQP